MATCHFLTNYRAFLIVVFTTQRETDRQTDRDRETERDRQRQRDRESDRERDRDRQTDRQSDKQTDRELQGLTTLVGVTMRITKRHSWQFLPRLTGEARMAIPTRASLTAGTVHLQPSHPSVSQQ